MSNNVLGKLEDMSAELEKAHALLGFIEDYFMHAKPDANQLLLRYKMYASLNHVASDILSGQADNLKEVINAIKNREQ